MTPHLCLYLSGLICLHPDRYGTKCNKGECPIPKKEEGTCNINDALRSYRPVGRITKELSRRWLIAPCIPKKRHVRRFGVRVAKTNKEV